MSYTIRWIEFRVGRVCSWFKKRELQQLVIRPWILISVAIRCVLRSLDSGCWSIGRAVLLLPLCGSSLTGCSSLSESNGDVIRVDSMNARAEADEFYQEGVQQFQHGKLPKAKASFEQAVLSYPGHGEAHNNLGLIYFNQRRLSNAAEHLDQAISLLPGDPRPVNNLGLVLEEGGRQQESIELFEQAWVLAPNNAEYLGNLTRASVRIGNTDDLLRERLRRLIFIEHRSDWKKWAQEQLVLLERHSEPPPDGSNLSLSGGASHHLSDQPKRFEQVEPSRSIELFENLAVPEPESN